MAVGAVDDAPLPDADGLALGFGEGRQGDQSLVLVVLPQTLVLGLSEVRPVVRDPTRGVPGLVVVVEGDVVDIGTARIGRVVGRGVEVGSPVPGPLEVGSGYGGHGAMGITPQGCIISR